MTSTTRPDGARRDRWRATRPLLAAAFWLAVWQGASLVVGHRVLLVGPWEVARRLWELAPTAELWGAVARTTGRISLGFVLAAVVGVALAAAAAWSRWVEALVTPAITVVRATPVVSFIILVLIWTDTARLVTVVSFLMALPIVYTTVLEGIGHRDRRLLEMAEVFDVGPWRRLLAIDVPGVLPYFVAACRTGIGLAWKSGIAAEVIGLPAGTIGERLYQAKIFLATADVFAWTVVVVVVASACERVVVAALGVLARRLSGDVVGDVRADGPGRWPAGPGPLPGGPGRPA
jgi:NitT/TauT family transport system permease protein